MYTHQFIERAAWDFLVDRESETQKRELHSSIVQGFSPPVRASLQKVRAFQDSKSILSNVTLPSDNECLWMHTPGPPCPKALGLNPVLRHHKFFVQPPKILGNLAGSPIREYGKMPDSHEVVSVASLVGTCHTKEITISKHTNTMKIGLVSKTNGLGSFYKSRIHDTSVRAFGGPSSSVVLCQYPSSL